MKHTEHLKRFGRRLRAVPRYVWLLSAVGVLVVAYALVFFIPKNITFSYAGQTCARQLLLFPSAWSQTGSDAVAVTPQGGPSVGSVHLFSTSVCVTPQAAFASGKQTAGLAPWGGPIFKKQFAVTVPEALALKTNASEKKSISAVRPLTAALTTSDSVHSYSLLSADKKAPCSVTDTTLTCPLAPLELAHGQSYDLELRREITNITKSQPVTSLAVTTLTPVAITDTSIDEGQTIYDAPTELTFTTDKPVTKSTVTLTQKEGETTKPIAVTTSVEGTQGKIVFTEPLPRKAEYLLTVTSLDADDGSTLDQPHVVSFKTSGGPKVTAVSGGTSGISRAERIVVTFDQPVDAAADAAKLARATGATVTITKLSPTQWAFTLQQAPLCATVKLTIDKGLKSGSNSASSDEAWSHSAKTICGTSAVIGQSVRGRPITAHYFGNGTTTILFTGGMHGSEPSGNTTMQAWVNHLMVHGDTIPADKRVVIVPNTNPDGIAAGSRNNVNNVNIGRNFPTANWKADIETTSGVLVNGGGASAASEPEARAVLALTRQLRPRLQVSYHAQGRLVGANKFGDSVAIGNTYAATVGYRTMFYDAEAVMGYPMTGEYEDWMGEEMGIPALLIELPTHSGNYFSAHLPALMKLLSV